MWTQYKINYLCTVFFFAHTEMCKLIFSSASAPYTTLLRRTEWSLECLWKMTNQYLFFHCFTVIISGGVGRFDLIMNFYIITGWDIVSLVSQQRPSGCWLLISSKKLTVAGCAAESKLDCKVNFIAPLYQKPNCSKMCCREQVELTNLFYVIKPAPVLSMLFLAFLTDVHQYYFWHPCQFSPIMSTLYHSAEMLTCRWLLHSACHTKMSVTFKLGHPFLTFRWPFIVINSYNKTN